MIAADRYPSERWDDDASFVGRFKTLKRFKGTIATPTPKALGAVARS